MQAGYLVAQKKIVYCAVCGFWGGFSELRKATISFVMSVCASVCSLPLDRFSWN